MCSVRSWPSLFMAIVIRGSADLIVVALDMFWCSLGLGVVGGRYFFDIWNRRQKPANTQTPRSEAVMRWGTCGRVVSTCMDHRVSPGIGGWGCQEELVLTR